jgi:hypothetical protein
LEAPFQRYEYELYEKGEVDRRMIHLPALCIILCFVRIGIELTGVRHITFSLAVLRYGPYAVWIPFLVLWVNALDSELRLKL